MSEKVIVVKNCEKIEKGEYIDDAGNTKKKYYFKLTDQEGKSHNIMRKQQDAESNWHDLSDAFDMLWDEEKDGPLCLDKAFKLYKSKVGQYYNVIKVEPVKDIMVQEAAEKLADASEETRQRSICLSYAMELGKSAIESQQAAFTPGLIGNVVLAADIFMSYMEKNLTIDAKVKAHIATQLAKEGWK
jgi:hypothetical protein